MVHSSLEIKNYWHVSRYMWALLVQITLHFLSLFVSITYLKDVVLIFTLLELLFTPLTHLVLTLKSFQSHCSLVLNWIYSGKLGMNEKKCCLRVFGSCFLAPIDFNTQRTLGPLFTSLHRSIKCYKSHIKNNHSVVIACYWLCWHFPKHLRYFFKKLLMYMFMFVCRIDHCFMDESFNWLLI